MSLKKISEKAGVHVSTVSRILNQDPKLSVAPETRERVLAIAREMNYMPNLYAKALRRSTGDRTPTGNIGVMVAKDMHPSYLGPFYASVYKGIESRAQALGYHLLLSAVSEDDGIPTLLTQQKIDGLILMGYLPPSFVNQATSGEFAVPTVLLDNSMDFAELDSVLSGSYTGLCHAAEYLIGLGHSRIAYVDGWFEHDPSLQARFRGFREIISSALGEIHPEYIVMGEGYHDRAYTATQELLALPEPPTAIIYNNDEAALEGMSVIREAGLSIPNDISVVGFDDIELAASAHPPLTTVSVGKAKMGEVAVELLQKRIDDRDGLIQRLTVPTELVIRESTAGREES